VSESAARPADGGEFAALRRELAERFPRVAVSHEWLTIPGGSEKVLEAILELLPHAELFTSIYDPDPWPSLITERAVHPSWLNRLPGARRRYPMLVPLMNLAYRSFDLSGFDLVVSSNHACAKNVRAPAGAPHVCYCHTPMRYAWDPSFLEGELGPVAGTIAAPVVRWLRRQDRRAAAGPDVFVANSSFVARRIEKYYRRDALVIHPPVDVERFAGIRREPRDYYLVLGRLVPYKRADHAVAACARMGRPLKVVGAGRAQATAQAVAGPQTEFLGSLPDERLAEVLAGARALLFPGEEDFGIVPVEVQAAGVPVIAYGSGGVLDSVIDGRTGVLYDQPTPAGLVEAIERFETMSFDDGALRRHARAFSRQRFLASFGQLLARQPAGSPA
jgi:glycosyltransferase involved in cell wall biosynthesis